MTIFVTVNLLRLLEMGRCYPWRRPDKCPACGNYKVWGHGFVPAWFDGFLSSLLLKRYRCPDCGCVIRCRPLGYFKRFQIPIRTIRERIEHRLEKGSWPPDRLSRSRQDHWLRALRRQAIAYLENTWSRDLLDAFDRLIDMGRTPVSRSI